MKEFKDLAGNNLDVGDYVVYAVRRSSSCDMKYGRILALVEPKADAYRPERKIKVQGVSRYYSGEYSLQVPCHLTNNDCLLRILSGQVDEKAIALLRKVKYGPKN